MSKNVSNRLRFLFAGIILLFILFNIIAFAIPFENKFNAIYWVSYGGVLLSVLATLMFVVIPINADRYHNDKCANRVTLFGCLYIVAQLATSIVFMAINSEDIKTWVSIVVVAVVFVVMVFLLIMAVVGSEEEPKEEEPVIVKKEDTEEK